jgi:ATP-binding cassette, subfamily B, bacterial MsbA
VTEPATPKPRPIRRLLLYARPYAWLVGVIILFSILYGGGVTGRAFILRGLVDDVALQNARAESIGSLLSHPTIETTKPEELTRERRQLKHRVRKNLLRVFLSGLALVVFMPIIRLVRDYASEWLMSRLLVDLQRDLASKLLFLPLGRHQRDSRGDAISRLTNDTAVANRLQSQILGDVLEDVGVVVMSIVGAALLSWPLALLLLAIGPPVAFVLSAFGQRIRKASRRRQEQVSEVMQRFVQILSGIKLIKAFGAEQSERRIFDDEILRYFRRSLRVVRNRVVSRSLVEFVTQGVMVGVVVLGIWAVIGDFWGLTLGRLIGFAFVTGSLYRPMKALTQLWNQVHETAPSAERIFEVIDAEAEVLDPPDAIHHPRLDQGIRFRDVVFHYGREEVLKGVDLEIPAGKTVALVGPTGSGKTTIADLVLRFHDPETGTMEFDGIDARKLSRKSIREMCAVVTQEPFLFDTTILENIRYGRPEASHDEVMAAARAANAHEFIEKLPQGYETPVGELGSQLSGGQRQRLTVARAILRDPQILILDEPTSALDAISERAVQSAIGELMKHRTVLVIAHRLSTVQSADRIAVLENGVISMTGTHDELTARGGLYQKLVKLQLSAAG